MVLPSVSKCFNLRADRFVSQRLRAPAWPGDGKGTKLELEHVLHHYKGFKSSASFWQSSYLASYSQELCCTSSARRATLRICLKFYRPRWSLRRPADATLCLDRGFVSMSYQKLFSRIGIGRERRRCHAVCSSFIQLARYPSLP